MALTGQLMPQLLDQDSLRPNLSQQKRRELPQFIGCAFRGNPPPDSDLIRPPVPI